MARERTDEDTELRIGATMGLPDVLQGLGVDPAKMFAEAGFDLALFDSPENMISFRERGRLMAFCVARTGCQHLGLLVGQRAGLHSLGMTGLLAKYSPDVETALRNLTNFMHLHVRGAVTSLTIEEKSARVSYLVSQPRALANDQVGDGAVAATFNIIRSLCGALWRPSQVMFAHRQPQDIVPFQRFFQAPLVFDAEQNAVVFPVSWLNRSLPQTDPELLGMLRQQVEALEHRYGDDFPGKVRRVLRLAIMTKQANEEHIATMFSMHSRTLRRHLQEFDTNFDELLDEIRYETARQMLEDTRMTVTQVALALNYANASSFTRAFGRWSGLTPARWRTARQVKVHRQD